MISPSSFFCLWIFFFIFVHLSVSQQPTTSLYSSFLHYSDSLEGILFAQSIMPQPSGRTYPETDDILRPLSPHLPIYKPQLTSTFPISHRIGGAFLATILLFFYLLCLKMPLICFTYENFYQFFFYFDSSKLILISVEITALALSYHLYNGVRHLLTDFSGFLFLRIGRKRLK